MRVRTFGAPESGKKGSSFEVVGGMEQACCWKDRGQLDRGDVVIESHAMPQTPPSVGEPPYVGEPPPGAESPPDPKIMARQACAPFSQIPSALHSPYAMQDDDLADVLNEA